MTQIRSLSPHDREAIAELVSRDGTFRPDEIACAMELVDAALGKAESNTYEILVAAEDAPANAQGPARPLGGTVIGYVCFGATPMTEATFDLYWIVVAPEGRGRGTGGTLLRATEQHLTERGVVTLRIETSSQEGQGGAARFYRRHGYEQVGHIADFYRSGDDLLTFAKRLKAS